MYLGSTLPIVTTTRITPEPSRVLDPDQPNNNNSSGSLYSELDSLIRRVSRTSEEAVLVGPSPKRGREPLSLRASSESLDREFESLSEELLLFGDMEDTPLTNRFGRTVSPVRASTDASVNSERNRGVARVTSWTTKIPVRVNKNIVIGERSGGAGVAAAAWKTRQRLRASSSPPTARIERKQQRHFPIPAPLPPATGKQQATPAATIPFTPPKRVRSVLKDSSDTSSSSSSPLSVTEICIRDENLSPASQNAYEEFGLFGLVQRMGQKNIFRANPKN